MSENYYQQCIDRALRTALREMLEFELFAITGEIQGWQITMIYPDMKTLRVTAYATKHPQAIEQTFITLNEPLNAAFFEQTRNNVAVWFNQINMARRTILQAEDNPCKD